MNQPVIRWLMTVGICLLIQWITSSICYASDNTSVTHILYLRQSSSPPAGVPDYLRIPPTQGVDGAKLAISDANITGKFTGFKLATTFIQLVDNDMNEEQLALLSSAEVVLIDSHTEEFATLVKLVRQHNPTALMFNVANPTDSLRDQFCTAPLLHTIPSYQMKTDALGQWLRTKRLTEILMVYGQTLEDKSYHLAFERTAKKFKLDVVARKQWRDSFDLRRSAFNEIPAFTRTNPQYQAVFAADTARQFSFSLVHNTYYLVPVIGSAGLQPLGWHFTHEQWGARQLQSRFNSAYSRSMNEVDFAAYVAVIAVSSALQHGQSSHLSGANIFQQLTVHQLSIAAYLGRPLTFNPSTRQLRQPIALAHNEALVTHAPMAGFLHQTNELDTLGASSSLCN